MFDYLIKILIAVIFIVSILLLSFSFVRLYRWRRSAFSPTSAYLQNFRAIRAGEKACIQAPESPGLQYVCSEKNTKAMIYWEYRYIVEGVPYCKSYFCEDEGDRPPARQKVYYNRKNPRLMYREGEVRGGVILSAFQIFLGALLLFVSICSLF